MIFINLTFNECIGKKISNERRLLGARRFCPLQVSGSSSQDSCNFLFLFFFFPFISWLDYFLTCSLLTDCFCFSVNLHFKCWGFYFSLLFCKINDLDVCFFFWSQVFLVSWLLLLLALCKIVYWGFFFFRFYFSFQFWDKLMWLSLISISVSLFLHFDWG